MGQIAEMKMFRGSLPPSCGTSTPKPSSEKYPQHETNIVTLKMTNRSWVLRMHCEGFGSYTPAGVHMDARLFTTLQRPLQDP
eukprot:2956740-Amphidinium_carterae.1